MKTINNGYTLGGGVLAPLIGAAFIVVLKLTVYPGWPWLWVLAPVWVSILICAVLFAILRPTTRRN